MGTKAKVKKSAYQQINNNHFITNREDKAARKRLKREVKEVSPAAEMRYLAAAPSPLLYQGTHLISSAPHQPPGLTGPLSQSCCTHKGIEEIGHIRLLS